MLHFNIYGYVICFVTSAIAADCNVKEFTFNDLDDADQMSALREFLIENTDNGEVFSIDTEISEFQSSVSKTTDAHQTSTAGIFPSTHPGNRGFFSSVTEITEIQSSKIMTEGVFTTEADSETTPVVNPVSEAQSETDVSLETTTTDNQLAHATEITSTTSSTTSPATATSSSDTPPTATESTAHSITDLTLETITTIANPTAHTSRQLTTTQLDSTVITTASIGKTSHPITDTAADSARSETHTSPTSAVTTPEPFPGSCDNINLQTAKSRNQTGGVYDVNILGIGVTKAYCDEKTDGGNWTVFQRRMDGSVDFYRNWSDYVNGFGNVGGEFWLGLEKIHALTKDGDCELRIDMIERNTNNHFYATYKHFEIGNSSRKYTLKVREYSGNATDAFLYHNKNRFSTWDQDNDNRTEENCALNYKGGWWYNGCHTSNLNGLFKDKSSWEGMIWFNAESHRKMYMEFSEMKIRRRVKAGSD